MINFILYHAHPEDVYTKEFDKENSKFNEQSLKMLKGVLPYFIAKILE